MHTSIIRQLRALMPMRPLELHEARGIAERQATRLIELLDQEGPAVDVGLIGELPRIEVKADSALRKTGIFGFSQWNRGRWLIVVNSDDSITRQRFTLGHEFKHVLDNPFARVAYSALGQTEEERHYLTEKVCDYFAACLLMPRIWLKRAWMNGIQSPAALAAMFGVSKKAMSIRLEEVGLMEPGSSIDSFKQSVRSYLRHPSPTRADARPVTM